MKTFAGAMEKHFRKFCIAKRFRFVPLDAQYIIYLYKTISYKQFLRAYSTVGTQLAFLVGTIAAALGCSDGNASVSHAHTDDPCLDAHGRKGHSSPSCRGGSVARSRLSRSRCGSLCHRQEGCLEASTTRRRLDRLRRSADRLCRRWSGTHRVQKPRLPELASSTPQDGASPSQKTRHRRRQLKRSSVHGHTRGARMNCVGASCFNLHEGAA